MTLRLTLVAQGATRATRVSAFPRDEPLETGEISRAKAIAAILGRIDAAWTSPGRAAVETAQALELDAIIDPALRDMEHGDWAGRPLVDIQTSHPRDFECWMQDTSFASPGGESVNALRSRVGAWLTRVANETGRVVAVTHAAWMRAAIVLMLDASPASFWRVDIVPLSICRFSSHAGRWVVQGVNLTAGTNSDKLSSFESSNGNGADSFVYAQLAEDAALDHNRRGHRAVARRR